MNRDAALRQALLNDMEIMRALITILYRQEPGLGQRELGATEILLRRAATATANILGGETN